MIKEGIKLNPKAKKCDYCDDYATHKIKEEDLYSYLCTHCYKNLDHAKAEINKVL